MGFVAKGVFEVSLYFCLPLRFVHTNMASCTPQWHNETEKTVHNKEHETKSLQLLTQKLIPECTDPIPKHIIQHHWSNRIPLGKTLSQL